MILGHLRPLLRERNSFTATEAWGSAVATQEIAVESLRHHICDGVRLFLDGAMADMQTRDGIVSAELKRQFEDKIRITDIRNLLREAAEEEILLFSGIEFLPATAQARWAAGNARFPICSIIYTVPSLRYLPHYLSSLIFLNDGDSIVVNSSAGQRAVKTLLEITAEIVEERWLHRPNISVPIVNIPLGVDTGNLQALDRATSRKVLGIPEDATTLLWVGRFSERYKADLEPLLKVTRCLRQEFPQLHLVLAGKDDDERYASKLNQIACEQGLQVTFIRNFPFSMKSLIYSAADVFVSPVDNIQETFGISIAEAMSFGLPVVASDWDGYRDLVVHGETGFLVPTYWGANDGEFDPLVPLFREMALEHALAGMTVVDVDGLYRDIKALVADRELRMRFGDAGRRRAIKMLDWSVVMRQFGDLWNQQVVNLNAKRSPSETRPKSLLNRIFGQYATRTVTSDFLLKPPSATFDGHQYNKVVQGRGQSILSECREGTRALATVIDDPNDKVTAISLAKKGFLAIAPPESQSSDLHTANLATD